MDIINHSWKKNYSIWCWFSCFRDIFAG